MTMENVALSPDTRVAAQNIASALGCSTDAATARALDVERLLRRHRELASHPRQALEALLAIEDPLPADDWRWLRAKRNGPFILALPLTLSALSIIARLVRSGEHFLCIEETSVTSTLLRFLGELYRGSHAMLMPASMQIRHRRMTAAEELARVIYVTFPDHHRASEGTSRVLPFFGEEHYVPLTEALLYFRGASPLVTLEAGTLTRYEVPPHDPIVEEDATALLAWLTGRIEAFARAGTHELLAWTAMSQRTCDTVRLNRAVHARMVEAFLRSWKSAAGIDDGLYRWSIGELARIHAANKSRAKGELR
jgi:hypothetical protein